MRPVISNKGFTLIEILIVIALIGILAAIISVGFQSSQQRGRDAKRKSDLQQVKKALEHAKNDCQAGSYYPYIGGSNNGFVYALLLNNNMIPNGYLNSFINDPSSGSSYNYYRPALANATPTNMCPNSSGTLSYKGVKTYVLAAKLEITSDQDSAKSFSQCQIATLMSSNTIVFPSSPAPSSGDGYYYVCPD